MANNKLSWAELRKLVAQMAGASEQEVGIFLNALVDAIIIGLKADQQVKLKGIGTFALKPMAARKSVNIATGEEFTIDEYNKLTFNAEATLKESVEKRIESPKTNNIMKELNPDPIKKLGEQANEIVDILADLGQSPEAGSTEEKPTEDSTTNGKKTTKKAKTTTKGKIEKTDPKTPVTKNDKPSETSVEVPQEVVEESKEQPKEETSSPHPKKPKCGSTCWVIIILILLGGGLYLRNYLRQNEQPKKETTTITTTIEPEVIDSLAIHLADSIDSVMVKAEEMVEELIDSAEAEYDKLIALLDGGVGNVVDESGAVEEVETAVTAKVVESEVDSTTSVLEDTTQVTPAKKPVAKKKPLTLAEQPRHYYKFIGIERVAQNSRLAWISKKYYGEKDLWVFIYEANRSIIKNPDYIRAGQHLRIPDLDPKYRNLNNPELRQLVDSLADEYLK